MIQNSKAPEASNEDEDRCIGEEDDEDQHELGCDGETEPTGDRLRLSPVGSVSPVFYLKYVK